MRLWQKQQTMISARLASVIRTTSKFTILQVWTKEQPMM
jgi:hypothetical protein